MKQCDIVRDLLPLYVDELTSLASNEMIESHLQTCDECKSVLTDLEKPIQIVPFPSKELDYLKKIRIKIKRAYVFCSIIAIIVLIGFLRFFIVGELTPFYEIDNVSYTFSEETNTVTISGILRNSEKSVGFVRAYPVKGANATRIEVHSVMSSFIHKDNHFSVSIPYTDDLYMELQEDGNRQMLLTASLFLPHICEVSNGEIIDGDLLETRTQGEEIKAIIAAAVDTGEKADAQEPQTDNYIQITLTGSGQHSLTSEFPRWCIYVYQKGSNYYAESPGENIKQLSLEDYGKIYSYMEHVKELHRRASTDLSPQDIVQNFVQSVTFDYQTGTLSFTVPKGLSPEYNLYIRVSGRIGMGDTGMSWHGFEEESENSSWEPGKTYTHQFGKDTLLQGLIIVGVTEKDQAELLHQTDIQIDDNGVVSVN